MSTQNLTLDIELARNNLSFFIQAMHDWEEKNYPLYKEALEKNQGLEQQMMQAEKELKAIFDDCCVPGKADRRRLGSVNAGWPTTYDINRDTLDEGSMVKQNILFLYQQNDGAKDLIRFTMKNHQGRWLIYKAEYFDVVKNKWSGYIL